MQNQNQSHAQDESVKPVTSAQEASAHQSVAATTAVLKPVAEPDTPMPESKTTTENGTEEVTQQTIEPKKSEPEANPQQNLQLSLEEKLANAERSVAEMQDAFLRAKAELDNDRRRAQEDIARAYKFSIEGFAESLLPVKDSLEAALAVAAPSLDSLKEGVLMTLRQLNAAFEKNRLTEINPVPGSKLDPMEHQAISMVSANQTPNTIVSVLQKGYRISDRLLRPALVTTAQESESKNDV